MLVGSSVCCYIGADAMTWGKNFKLEEIEEEVLVGILEYIEQYFNKVLEIYILFWCLRI